ncbi:transposase [Ensifer sp. IC3342]|nr:transposase [Ensifer sp. BRP08]MCA1451095.1 transposase [Ensifer sp. IC3342]
MLGLQEVDQKKRQKGCNGKQPFLLPAPHGRERTARTRDATDMKAREPLSRGCCVAVLYNDHRPHSGLGWLTPAEFAQSTNPRRDAVLRSRNGSAPQPAATAADAATQNRWSELKAGKNWGQGQVQYACGAYSELLHLHGIQASMSRVGNPYDNAKAESFMKALKQEEVQGLAYRDADDARRRIGAFIDTVYNTQRLHSALDYLTPEEYEQMHSGGRRMEKGGIAEHGKLSAIFLVSVWGCSPSLSGIY